MRALAVWVVVALLPLTASFTAASAQEAQSNNLRVATRVLPPMVTEDQGEFSGFSIDLWHALAARLKLKSTITAKPNVGALLDALKAGEADVGIAAISITADRDQEFDFSQPMLDGGLQILVRSEGEPGQSNPLRGLWKLISSPQILVWLGVGLLFVLLPAHVLWFLERGKPKGLEITKTYYPGIFQAVWWTAGCLLTQAGGMPQHWLSRCMALVWMFFAIVFTALYTAELTADLTVQRIQSEISGPADLPGKKVATTSGSTAARYLQDIKADVLEVGDIGEAYKALADKKADAVVFDSPVLRHYASHEGKGRVEVVGNVFHDEDYGIAFPQGSLWRKRINGALLSMREDGSFQKLYDKWFAAE